MRAEERRPDPPRCPACGRYMETQEEKERLTVYWCCNVQKTLFAPEFVPPDEVIR